MQPVKPSLPHGTAITLANGVPAELYGSEDTPGVRFVVTRWELSYAERQAVARGQDVFLVQSTDADTVNGAVVLVGPDVFDNVALAEGPESVPTNAEGEEDPERINQRETEML